MKRRRAGDEHEAWRSTPVDDLDLVGLILDGLHIGDHCLIVALGIAAGGQKTRAGAVGPLAIERVTTAEDRLVFRELVGRHHYLGAAVPYGAYLRYLVSAMRPPRQVAACVQFSSAAWRMAPRDTWIGWADATRVRHLPQVVNYSRFLVLPWIAVKNLASTLLSRVARQLVPDWTATFGVTPLLLETLVDPRRFDGACYRAANWIVVGTTAGRGRNDRHRRVVRAPKRALVYPLVPDAARRLRGQ